MLPVFKGWEGDTHLVQDTFVRIIDDKVRFVVVPVCGLDENIVDQIGQTVSINEFRHEPTFCQDCLDAYATRNRSIL